MKPGLPDVNVLIALIDRDHKFHASAKSWFKDDRRGEWATCPITENGCLRVMSNPGYPAAGLTVDRVRGVLCLLAKTGGHRFWPDSVSLLDAGRFELASAGPKHLTDLYLLGLAVKFNGRLITFDRAIRWQWVTGCGPENLEVI